MNWLNAFGETVQTQPEALSGFGVAQDNELTRPTAFQGTGEAVEKAIPFSYYRFVSGANELIADKVEVNYDLDNNEDALSDFRPTQDQRDQAAERIRQDAKFARLKAQNDYTPNPEITGQAAMMIHGLTSSLTTALTYTLLTGGSGILAAPLFGADLGLYEAGKLRDKGVDEATARKAGAITGTVNAVGMALPGAIGTSYVKSILFGGLANPATDSIEQASIKFVLDNANYSKQSQEYDPFDPVNLGVSAGMGIAFGALGARANRAQARYEAAEAAAQLSMPQTPESQAAPATNMNKGVLDSIQNRDRSSKESRLQMEKIASAPNFNLLRESRSLDQGAPIIAYVPDDMNILWGKRVDVSADPSSEPMTMRYAVVDADDVLTSNAVDGSSNPQFTDPTVAGARAIAGNGRIAGLQGAYRQVKATKYRADLTNDSKEFGISKRKIKKMKNPILVRVMDDADVVEGIGEASNRTGTLKLNPAEQAAQDARNVRLEEVEFTKDGEITRKSMDEFVRRTPDKEGLIDSNGNALYDNIARRMRPAIFAAAFSDTRIINRFIADSPEDRKIMNVLQSVATEVVRLKKIKGELDFSPDLLEAVADVFETRREAKKINGKGHEKELTGSLMEESATPAQRYFRDILLSANPERLQEILARFREVAEQESGAAGFFEAVTKDQVFQMVKKEFDSFDRAVNEIEPSHVDAAMELQYANVIQDDQPVGKGGDVNRSIADERKAAEQIDNGERVEVSGEGVDPEVMDKNVSDFVTRFVKELVGAGAEKKVAEMGAKVHDAFFETLGIRLGKNRKELEQEYAVRVKRGASNETSEGFTSMSPQDRLNTLNRSREFDEQLKLWEQGKGSNNFNLGRPSWVLQIFGVSSAKQLSVSRRNFVHVLFGKDEQSMGTKGKHDLSHDDLRGLLVAVQSPIAVFKSSGINAKPGEKAIVLLTELQKEGKNIVVPVHLTYAAKDGTVRISNRIPSAYDKKSVEGWIKKGLLLGYDKEKGPAYLLRGNEPNARNQTHQVQDLATAESHDPLNGAIVYQNEISVEGFYQSEPVDPLITVHNISEENLNKSLDLGGFAAPSLGITKQRTPYSDFGEISLIGTRDMVDPRTGTPVFSQDAYTQTFPEPVWERSVNEEGANRFNEQIEAAAKESGFEDDPRRFAYNLKNQPDKNGVIKQLLVSKLGAYMFLKDKGIKVAMPEDPRRYGYALKDKANEFRDEFEAWAEKFASQAFDAPMIEVRGKLKPITLENVVDAMRSNLVRNKESTMTFGPGKIRAAAAKQFDSLESIQASRGQIADSQTVNAQNAEAKQKLDTFRDRATNEYSGRSFDALDESMAALAKVASLKSKPTEARVRAALQKKGFNPSDETVKLGVEILNDIKKAMTDYFEAKPQRAVKANEFRGAVVPDGTSEATIRRLEKAGITVAKYDADAYGSRERVIRDLTNKLNEKSGDILFQNEDAPRGIYTPGERVITLMQSANESTFIHESGHYFLDVLTDVAMKENAPAQVKADVQTLMTWFGVKDLDEWRSLSIDEQRAAHEQFARGFEQYLREGEAPSTALEKVFKAFKDWLTKIYKSSEELQVEISPEVRAVYDRLLATDEQIRARKEIETPSLFGGMETEETPANPVVKAVQQTAEQVIDQAPISEDSKARIRETLGINQPEQQTGENHPRHKVMSDDEFVDNEFQKVLEDQPGLKIYDENGKEIDVASFMETTNQKAQELRRTANSMGEAALCMWNQGGLEDL